MKKIFQIVMFTVTLVCTEYIGAQVRLPRLISDNMILQRDIPLKIWGWASPGERITVTFSPAGKKTFSATAGEKGEWMLFLPAQKPGGPHTMTIKGSNEISIHNILIGDVWLCSGQSNMELWMGRLKYKYSEEMSKPVNPSIRQFLVPDKYDFNQPQTDLEKGEWLSVGPSTIGDFSAVAYFFAKEIVEKHRIPIGIINTALGGSPAEAWISEGAIKKFPAYFDELIKYKSKDLITITESRDQRISTIWNNYINEFDEGYKKNWKDPAFNDDSWKQMKIPGYWADTETGPVNGVVWFRKEIDVPLSMTTLPVKLELGRIVDADSVFINGKFAGSTGYQYPPRRYELPAGILKAGKNSIVMRVVNNSGKGGFVPEKRYELTGLSDTISLEGLWHYKVGVAAKPLPGNTVIRWKPVGLYNAMIAPLRNYAIKGALWYQGESNAGRPADYKELMQTLISDWRAQWGQGDFPFYFVQLANFMEASPVPRESGWAALRQQQLNTLSVPNTGMAVIIDAGEWNDIHPEDKQTVGYRLALLARKNVYGEKKLVASGPLYQSMKKEGNKIILTFTHTGSGLQVKGGGELKQFAIAGADKKFVWAKAVIRNNMVEVWSDAISDPVAVRYAWADNPEGCNLYNKEGLPASPFSTEN